MTSIVLCFLFFALLLYVMLGGADFGAGIVEMFSSIKNQKITKKTTYDTMGPIWEANHIWLILVIVILWVGFPPYFNVLVTYLHIPLALLLIGVTLRGLAFIFRHYDAYDDGSQKTYNFLFKMGSFMSPFLLGMIYGGLTGGSIHLNDKGGFAEIFLFSWVNFYSLLTGLFYVSLCAFIASNFLMGEAKEDGEAHIYRQKARYSTVLLFIFGILILIYGYINDMEFSQEFIHNPYSWIAIGLMTLILIPLWKMIQHRNRKWTRILASIQVCLILFSTIVAHFPEVILTADQKINLIKSLAPASVIQGLGISLIIGGIIVLPGLFHLMRTFKLIKLWDDQPTSTRGR